MPTEIELAEQEVRDAEKALIEARAQVVQQHAANRQLKVAFAVALKAFKAEFPILDRDALVKHHCASEAQLRADIAAGRVTLPARAPARSHIDKIAQYSAGGTADDHARSQMRLGYRRGWVAPDGSLQRAFPRSRFGQKAF